MEAGQQRVAFAGLQAERERDQVEVTTKVQTELWIIANTEFEPSCYHLELNNELATDG